MSTKQEEKYKRRYERLVQQLTVLHGTALNKSTTTLQLTASPYSAGGYVYSVLALTSGDSDTVLVVHRTKTYPEDIVAVIGQEARKRLRERIRNARTALR